MLKSPTCCHLRVSHPTAVSKSHMPLPDFYVSMARGGKTLKRGLALACLMLRPVPRLTMLLLTLRQHSLISAGLHLCLFDGSKSSSACLSSDRPAAVDSNRSRASQTQPPGCAPRRHRRIWNLDATARQRGPEGGTVGGLCLEHLLIFLCRLFRNCFA